MKAGRISVGIVGIGRMASYVHLPILSRTREAALVALCDQEVAKARAAAERFNVPRVYSSLEEMLSSEHLDLLDICLPPHEHKGALTNALEHRVNCLVEKPLTVATADADAVISLAQDNKVGVYVIHNYSAIPAILQAKRLIDKGSIGQVVGVSINQFVRPVPRYLDPNHWCHSLPGEYFGELAPHLAMLLVDFIGPINRVETVVAKLSPDNSLRFDELRITAQNQRAVGTITCSLNCPALTLTIDIAGTEGTIHTCGDYQAVVRYRPVDGEMSAWGRGLLGVRDIVARTSALARTSANVLIGRYTPITQGHRYLIQHCLWALQGKGNYPIDTSQAREAVRLLEMAFQQISGS